MTLQFETSDPSESSSGTSYDYGVDASGRVACNCKGWCIQKKESDGVTPKPRECKHTKRFITKHSLTVRPRTEGKNCYFYVANGSTVPMPTPQTRQVAVVDVDFDKVAAAAEVLTRPEIKRGFKTVDAPAESDGDAYVKPMLASPMPNIPDQKIETVLKALATYSAAEWAMEEKFDGHRVTVSVRADATVKAWSRPRAGKEALVRELPTQIAEEFAKFPQGTYDGELIVPGAVSTGVTDLKNVGKEVFVVFDVVRLLGMSVIHCTYDARREYLKEIFERDHIAENDFIQLSASGKPDANIVRAIWKRGGEGAILKRRAATYQPGARSKDFIKIKGLEVEVMVITGYEKGKLGPCASVKCQNPKDGSQTKFAAMGGGTELLDALHADPKGHIGRRALIEYQFRTDDGNYRHPRFDRWESE